MNWVWQSQDWPNFKYNQSVIEEYERKFIEQAGLIAGITQCIQEQDRDEAIISLMSSEALKTSSIEGEHLNRDSLRSSIRRQLGLGKERTSSNPKEEGIAEVMVDLYRHDQEPLSHEKLSDWHEMVTRQRWDLQNIACYRTHEEAMEIVSGNIGQPRVHYEAPPSKRMQAEMDKFLSWYDQSLKEKMPALTRSAIAHIYFLCIHPFEDGNGRIARAMTLKSLSETMKQPILIALSHEIEANKKAYYSALARGNHSLEITEWIKYFAITILSATQHTLDIVKFLVAKNKFFAKYSDKLNERQTKVIQRIFREGLDGFKGGLSAANYISITKTSASTATRDLNELIKIGAFYKTGELKGARYFIRL